MGRCIPTKAPPAPVPSLSPRCTSTCRVSRAEGGASPSRTRISRLQRQASEQGAAGQPLSEFREVEQVLEGWQRQEGAPKLLEQDDLEGSVIDHPALHPSGTELQRKKEVEEALKLVNAAMKAAEGQLDDIPNLPSARLKRKVTTRTYPHLPAAIHKPPTGQAVHYNMYTPAVCICFLLHCIPHARRLQEELVAEILPSAGERGVCFCLQTPEWVRALLSVVKLVALSSAAIFSHACGPAVQLASSAAVGAVLGYSGLRKGSLSKSGAATSTHLRPAC